MMPRRPPLPVLLLRSFAFVALTLTLLLSSRVEWPAALGGSRGPQGLLARLAAESEAATLSVCVDGAQASSAPLHHRECSSPNDPRALRQAERGRRPFGAATRARAGTFPRILSVLRGIPRLGSEEPPWNCARAV